MINIDKELAGLQEDLHNFTNRAEQTALVRKWLATPSGYPLPMQMFYGVGGAGKSMFVARLRQILLPEPLPLAFIDFDTASGSNPFTNDIPATLFEISRQLGVICPRFELSYAAMLKFLNQTACLRPGTKSDSLPEDLIEEGATEVLEKAAEWAELTPFGVGVLVKLVRAGWDYAHEPARQQAYREFLSTEEGKKLLGSLRMANAARIAGQLGGLLALDLDERLRKPAGRACRALIVFDTVEHLQRSGLTGLRQFTDREKWIFDLWKALRARVAGGEPTPFVQIMLFGRDQLKHWEENSSEIHALRALEQHLLGGFSEKDARDFLGKKQILEPAVQEAILDSSLDMESHDGPKGYHALSLGLLADTVAEDRRAGRNADPQMLKLPPGKLDELASRFLQSLPSSTEERRMVRLARTPRFDKEALQRICSPDQDTNIDERRRILAYTFVQAAATPGWFVVHPRVREAILSLPKYSESEETRQENRDWEEIWKTRSKLSSDEFAGLAWFHHYQIDRDGALTAWRTLAETARKELRMRDHSKLLDWWIFVGLEMAKDLDLFGVRALNILAEEIRRAGTFHDLSRAVAGLQLALRVTTRQNFPQEWALTRKNLGTTLRELGTRTEGSEGTQLLGDAVLAFRAALEVFEREALPEQWASTQNNLGNALREQGTRTESKEGVRLLGQAVAAFREVLKVFTRTDSPEEWATTQNNLGNALIDQGIRNWGQTGVEILGDGVAAFRAALEVRTHQSFPQQWAATQNNLGVALIEQGIRKGEKDGGWLLGEAVAACRAALEVFTFQELPQQWATTQNGLGYALLELGTLKEGPDAAWLIGESVAAFRAALDVFTRPELPQDWGMTQNNLGAALKEQGVRVGGADGARLLEEAVGACKAALEVFTHEELPQQWAMTQFSLATVLRETGVRTAGKEGNTLLNKAVTAYRSSLEIRTRQELPQQWAATMDSLGVALREQGARLQGLEATRLLDEATMAHRSALEVFTRGQLPYHWAATYKNLGDALRAQSIRAGGDDKKRLQDEAAAAYRAALEVFTPEESPRQWKNTTISVSHII